MQVNLKRVDLITVGALSKEYAAIAGDYERRLTKYLRFEVHEIRAQPLKIGRDLVLEREAEKITTLLDRLYKDPHQSRIIALDIEGKAHSTEQLAATWPSYEHMILLIGGSFGLADSVRRRANSRVSFGKITLPHQLARVIATEQLYRVFRIVRGEPYHW